MDTHKDTHMKVNKPDTYRNYAFISYCHRDMAVAKWLQRRLERFKLPTEIHNEIDAKSRYLRPVFRDQSDLDAGILGDELRKHLEESKYLIVVCSSHSARSRWVSQEAEAFVEMGRIDRIIPVIVPGGDAAGRDLFPASLREYFVQHPDRELLGVCLGESGKEKGLLRVVSRMLDVSFDSLWQRHKRQKRLKVVSWAVSAMAALLAAYIFAIPVAVQVSVELARPDLPVSGDIAISIDGGKYACSPVHGGVEDVRLPGYKRLGDMRLAARARFFVPVDTLVSVGFGLRRGVCVSLKRDDSFAVFGGKVYDDMLTPLAGVDVSVMGMSSTTDSTGRFEIILPLSLQQAEQAISLHKAGYKPIVREDEPPGTGLRFIMHK